MVGMAERARALLPVLPDRASFSHATAAMIWGAPLPRSLEDGPVHVTVVKPDRGSSRRGVRWHETDADLPAAVAVGLPVVEPAAVFCQLGSQLSLGSLVAVGDFFVTGDEPVSGIPGVAAVDHLKAAVQAWGSRRGARILKQAVDLVRWGPLSRPESILRVALVLAGFAEPSINHRVWHPGRLRHFMVDLAFVDLLIAFEYEGDYHRTVRGKFESDIRRREYLAEIGWTVIRVTAFDLAEGRDEFVERVHIHVARARSTT